MFSFILINVFPSVYSYLWTVWYLNQVLYHKKNLFNLMHLMKSLNCESPIAAIKKLWNGSVCSWKLVGFFSKPNISSMHGRMIQRETRKSTNGVYRKEVFIFNSDVENNLQLGKFYEDCKKVITLLALDPPWTKIELLTR